MAITLRARLNLLTARSFGRPVSESALIEDAKALGLDADDVLTTLLHLEATREARRSGSGWLPASPAVQFRGHVAWAERSRFR